VDVQWEEQVKQTFDRLIEKVPVFMQGIARDKVSHKAKSMVEKHGRTRITEKDMVDAFFAETPFGFHGPMKHDMEQAGIDYMKYGYEK